MQDKLTLAFDIDGTLCTIDKALEVFNRETGKFITPETMYAYEFKKVYELEVEHEISIWKKYTTEVALESGLNTRLVNYLHKRKKQGARIVLVTARQVEFEKQTRDWLLKHEIPFDKLYMGETDKYQTLKDEKADRFFDDKGSLVENLMHTDLAEDCELTIVDSAYNKDFISHSRFYA